MKKAALTVQAHLTGIKNWIKSKINNGILEGLNSVVQAAKRKERGYGRQHFHTMTFLLTGKLNLSRVNTLLPTRFEKEPNIIYGRYGS
jgi:transposase